LSIEQNLRTVPKLRSLSLSLSQRIDGEQAERSKTETDAKLRNPATLKNTDTLANDAEQARAHCNSRVPSLKGNLGVRFRFLYLFIFGFFGGHGSANQISRFPEQPMEAKWISSFFFFSLFLFFFFPLPLFKRQHNDKKPFNLLVTKKIIVHN
jgi:hypothetical protein